MAAYLVAAVGDAPHEPWEALRNFAQEDECVSNALGF